MVTKVPPTVAIGEIWCVSLDDTEGHEQHGTRPALVIAIHQQTNLIMTIPFTGSINALRFPYSHKITPSNTNGLTQDSAALVFQTRCLSLNRFQYKMGDLEQTHFDTLKRLLEHYCDL